MYFLIALLPALLYGFMGLVLMKLGGDSRQQTVGLAGGAIGVAVILALVVGLDTGAGTVIPAVAGGVVVGAGIYFQLRGFHKIGVSRVMPPSTGLQLIGISLLGVLMFGEWLGTPALPVGLIGLALVVAGVTLTAWEEDSVADADEDVFAIPYDPLPVVDSGLIKQVSAKEARAARKAKKKKRPEQWVSGMIDTLVSTALFIAFPIIIRYWEVDPLRSFLFQTIGIAGVAVLLTFPFFTPALGPRDTRWSKYTLRATIPGAMWGLGVVLMQFSQITVGVAVGFSLSQLGVIISTFGGILFLGEKRTRKEMISITIGVALLVVGALLLGWAKTLDVPA